MAEGGDEVGICGGVDRKLFPFCSYRPEKLAGMLMGERGELREEVAIKNVVQGRRLEGGSPWLLFFVLSTLAPPLAFPFLPCPHIFSISLPLFFSYTFIFFLLLALCNNVVTQLLFPVVFAASLENLSFFVI